MVSVNSLAFPGLVLTATTRVNITFLLSEVAASETTYARWAQRSITEKWCRASTPGCGKTNDFRTHTTRRSQARVAGLERADRLCLHLGAHASRVDSQGYQSAAGITRGNNEHV